jgi:hypothetical protein
VCSEVCVGVKEQEWGRHSHDLDRLRDMYMGGVKWQSWFRERAREVRPKGRVRGKWFGESAREVVRGECAGSGSRRVRGKYVRRQIH